MLQLNLACEPKQKLGRSLPRRLQICAVALLVIGIFFRFYNLDRKVYWLDEARTSLRMSGHTQTELVEEIYTGQVVDAATLQAYQRPGEKDWGDTFHALQGNAEHTPLYFLLARLWTEGWGYSVANIRGLSVFFSLLVFPCLFWLCRELFASHAVGWVAIALVSITPLHVLYAQEARPYSLWTVEILLSSALLLGAMRTTTRWSWVLYGASLTLGLYTQLLFGKIMIAHGIYVAIVENIFSKRRLSPTARSYLIATGMSFLSLIPWLVLFFSNLEQVQESTATLNLPYQFSTLINEWVLNFSRGLIDRELGSLNTVGLILVGFAPLYYLYRKTPRVTWLMILALVAVSFLVLALPDIFLGGQRSLRIRYLIPAFLGIQIAIAFLFVNQFEAGGWGKRLSQLMLAGLIIGGIEACFASAQAQVWWNKSIPRSAYYPAVSTLINQASNPLVLSDDDPAALLAISYWVKPNTHFQLVSTPKQLKVAEGFAPIFLLNPSKRLRNRLERKYKIRPVYEDHSMSQPAVRLWQIEP
ncbi:MAG: hypothetical protein HC781_16740 [Leptolyngbyaceae cyanobacterium CSU_1_4]|nr:hypothetical protein [Leptolyngbyaceae cyanobacterium CSU_1_4]